MTRGLLVGAFERDNFGDLLFLALTRHFLGQCSTSPTAPFGGYLPDTYDERLKSALEPSLQSGQRLQPYDEIARESPPAFVWVVGGETGGTSMKSAFEMAALASDLNAPTFEATITEQHLLLEVLPYLPRPTRIAETFYSPYIINSAGLSGVARLTSRRHYEALSAIKEASYVSVRDWRSHALMRKSGVNHFLSPDLVHTIPSVYSPPNDANREVALLQAKTRILQKLGIDNFVQAIAETPSLYSYELRLFSAGEAPGHDSTPLLLEVADRLRSIGYRGTVTVSTAKTALQKVDEIANSGLWIGTSLHGLIISTAFQIPRVGLMLQKLRGYADTWQIDVPSNVHLGNLDRAIQAVTSTRQRRLWATQANQLASLAEANARRAATAAGTAPSRQILDQRRLLASQNMPPSSIRWNEPWVSRARAYSLGIEARVIGTLRNKFALRNHVRAD